jgi:hypothetical protein
MDNDPATAIMQAIEQITNTLSDQQRNMPYGKLLVNMGPHIVHIGKQVHCLITLDFLKSSCKFLYRLKHFGRLVVNWTR